MANVPYIINTSTQYAKLPLDAGQYIQEALITVSMETEYSPGEDDNVKTRTYNLIYLRAIEVILYNNSTPDLRKVYTPVNVIDGYGPLPHDFLCTYQHYYDIQSKEINGVYQLCGKANQCMEYVSMPNMIGALHYACRNAIQDRFLANCKTLNASFASKGQVLEMNAVNSTAGWSALATQQNHLAHNNRTRGCPR